MTRHLVPGVAAALISGLLLAASLEAVTPQVRLLDLQGQLVDPLHADVGTKAIVLLFLSTDCPISNRYAPEMRRLADTFAPRGVVFRLIYPNPAESPKAIQAHVDAFAFPGRALNDPQHALVRLAHATVSSETAVFSARGDLVYRGRIDDRFVDIGIERPAPTTHDLADVLDAVLAGRSAPQSTTKAVGCFLADLK